MPGLFLLTPGTKASLLRESIHLEIPASEPDGSPECREILLHDIEQVVTTTAVQMTMQLLAECMKREIPVVVTAGGDRILGMCMPPVPHSTARLAQYRRTMTPAFGLALAVALVEAKIQNSRRVLQRLAACRDLERVRDILASMDEAARNCRRAESLETLRGYEGTAAGRYFEAYGNFFPDECPFERRSRRPPHNASNAILSYAYTLLGGEMECFVQSAGLDAAVGFYHEPADRRASLALDLIEPFRAPVADALAIDLVSHGQLKPAEHFETREGGVYLNMDGRRKFFVAYERRMTREFLSEQTGERTTLRDTMRKQVVALKQSILNDEMFEPFLMN